jgi:hypothetical protein
MLANSSNDGVALKQNRKSVYMFFFYIHKNILFFFPQTSMFSGDILDSKK